MRATPAAAAAAVLALALAGCSNEPEPKDTYESGAEFAKALNQAGDLGCDEEPQEEQMSRNGWVMVSCDNAAGGIFESDAKRDWVTGNSANGEDWVLQGRNWTIRAAQFTIEDLQKKLGGEILTPDQQR